jgi:hypothetical protein
MAKNVQLELSKGVAPNGRRIVSEANITKRRERGVQVGQDAYYGMGLFSRVDSGIQVVTHGGTLQGFHSNWWALPDQGIGAVVLTNADTGPALLAAFERRLLEVVFDGKSEAKAQIDAAAARSKAQAAARKARLTLPGDAAVLSGLASRYVASGIGSITVSDRDGGKWVEAGSIRGPLATRKNADGSISIVSIAPGGLGLDAVVGTDAKGGRTLTVRESQHEYVYAEVK